MGYEFAVSFFVALKIFQTAAAAISAAAAVTWQAGLRLLRGMTNVVVPIAIRSSAGLWALCFPSGEHRRRTPALVLAAGRHRPRRSECMLSACTKQFAF